MKLSTSDLFPLKTVGFYSLISFGTNEGYIADPPKPVPPKPSPTGPLRYKFPVHMV